MIRFANRSNINAIQVIENLSFEDGRYSKEQLLYEYKENPFAKILVNIVKEEVVGFLIYMVTFNSATIVQIATHPVNRKHGVGTALLNAMEKDLLKKYGEIETVTLEVRANNITAHNFYLNNGYKDVHVKKKYYDNGDDAIYMMKVLL